MKHLFSVMNTLLLAVSLAACTPSEPPAPAVTPPVIDGSLSPGEWDTARQESLADGSRLFLLKSGDYLYVGIQANPGQMIAGLDLLVGSVYLYRGDEISILHASAALGTAIYQQTADGWSQTQGFTWCCRDYSDSQEAQAARETFLNQDGWVASIGYMGTFNELEFKIRLTGEPMRMAVAFYGNPRAKIVWPSGVKDDTLRFISGNLTDSASLLPEKWAEITVNRDGELELMFE
jgi:hypothetical protein